jgi:predicted DNA-binding ribbon-helix-helix protein
MSGNTKHSVVIAGHRTSVSLEPEFWREFASICREEGIAVSKKVEEIDSERDENLSSAIRLFVLNALRERLARSS